MTSGQIDVSLVGGKYRLEERLGEGALGAVYRAVHLGLEKAFAIKLLRTAGASSPDALARFRREAVALGRLRHPHIVAVTDSGIDEPSGVPYLVMELLEGVPLSDVCREEGPLPLGRALPVLGDIAEAVDAAHDTGILHCDLKPGNVLVCTDGIKVLDFGLAELLNAPDVDDSTQMLGTPLYVAPELVRDGKPSRASDVYSFGVLAYEILGGRPPFQGTVAEVLKGHLEGEPPPLSLPPEVGSVLLEALQKDPSLRPATAGEVVRRLRKAAAQAERRRWKSAEIPRRVRMAALLAAVLVAVGFLLPWPPLPAAERWIQDWRVWTSPQRPPDPRILLITFDEASLRSTPLSLADRADEIGLTLSRIFDAGARRVAVGFLLPAKWSTSTGFSDLLLQHPGELTLAAFSSPDGSVVGPECIDPLTAAALGPARVSELFGFVNLDEDPDGIVRRGRLRFRDRSGGERPSWAARAAHPAEYRHADLAPSFSIDTRIDWPRYATISWWQVPAALDRGPEQFRGRLVLVGGDVYGSGDDYHRISHRTERSTEVSGLTLQALMVDTIEAGLPIREPGRIPVLAVAVLGAAFAMAGALCARRTGPLAAVLVAGAGTYLALSFPIFWWTSSMLPVTAPLLLVLLGVLTALALRRFLSSPPEVPAP